MYMKSLVQCLALSELSVNSFAGIDLVPTLIQVLGVAEQDSAPTVWSLVLEVNEKEI